MWKTPAMQQFVRFKKEHPECLLLFRMGDFYELFGEDALVAHKALGITLTERTKGMPMAGVPYHSLDNYLHKLIDHGYRVAICDQVQDPRDAIGVVDRAVTRVLTPGTLVDETLLDDSAANHVAGILVTGERACIAAAELSTGVFELHEVPVERLLDELARIAPAEIVHAEIDGDKPPWLTELQQARLAPLSPRPGWTFQADTARQLLETFHGVATLEAYGLAGNDLATSVAGGLLRYLQETQCPRGETKGASLAHVRPPHIASESDHLVIDASSLRSLEVVKTMRSGGTQGTLLAVLQRGKTPMGRRLLRDWLCWPLRDLETIRRRQRAIGAFMEDEAFATRLRAILSSIQDVARIGARIAMGRATPRDVVALGSSLARLVELLDELEARPAFAGIHGELGKLGLELAEIEERIVETCVENAPSHLRAGGLFKEGFDSELDEMRLLQRDANQWLAEFQARIIEETAITSLKVGFNKVFGYYIELSNTNVDKAPDSFTRKQTLKNAERYVTPELKEFEEKVTSAESRSNARERELFDELCLCIAEQTGAVAAYAAKVAEIDCLLGLAEIAAKRGWCCPMVEESVGIEITGGRPPRTRRASSRGIRPERLRTRIHRGTRHPCADHGTEHGGQVDLHQAGRPDRPAGTRGVMGARRKRPHPPARSDPHADRRQR